MRECVHVYIFPKNLNTYEDFWLVPGIESDVWISDEHLRIIAYAKLFWVEYNLKYHKNKIIFQFFFS
jgi:sulfur relay (sulfurtransferase) DsrC/TusE family protein